MRESGDIENAVNLYGDTVWRVCGLYFRAHVDAQDAFQETFMKYALADKTCFHDEDHRKAWLIRVATNVCKDMLKACERSTVFLDDAEFSSQPVSTNSDVLPASFESEVIDAMRSLDDPPRTPLYLSLYEGYSAPEIARIVNAPVNTVYSWISRGKQKLREVLS